MLGGSKVKYEGQEYVVLLEYESGYCEIFKTSLREVKLVYKDELEYIHE